MSEPRTIIRLDSLGRPDDLVIDCDLLRVERMDDNVFWIAAYRGNKRVAMFLSSDRRGNLELAVSENDLGVTAEEGGPGDRGKDPAAVEMGRRGGLARAAALTPERRSEIARKAAEARWERHYKSGGAGEGGGP